MDETRPLAGRRVLITRPAAQAQPLAEGLSALGAIPVLLPSIRIEAIRPVPGLEAAIVDLARYDWVVFTSANGVEIFLEWLQAEGLGSEALAGCSVAAIGPATAEALRARGLRVEYVPGRHVGEALADGLPRVGGRRVLLPRAEGSRPELPERLRGRGAEVDEFAIYRAVAAEADPNRLADLAAGVDAITFTSPSTVRHFLALVEAAGLSPFEGEPRPAVACIGPVTAEAARQAGLPPAVVAQVYTVAGLLEALVSYYEGDRVHEPSP